ncbi:MAG: hypothetical protein FJ297_17395 [Planctomycetes bacterium]|nr:hypothetical protein [Planctomycetota bacterium]
METSLHRELKRIYAGTPSSCEVRIGDYRIDATRDGTLIEIQHGSLAAIRAKLDALLADGHRVLVVKPIVRRKLLVQLDRRRGAVVRRRYSPKQGDLLDVFQEMVYLARIFPHPSLAIDAALCDIEEIRYPRTGRKRWNGPDYRVEDQKLVHLSDTRRLATSDDLGAFLPSSLPDRFHTGHLAASLGCPRWIAQKIAYCLRACGQVRADGKQGNAVLHRLNRAGPSTRAPSRGARRA